MELTNAATGGPFTAQITRGDAEALGLKKGDFVMCVPTRCHQSPGSRLTLNDTGAAPTLATPRSSSR